MGLGAIAAVPALAGILHPEWSLRAQGWDGATFVFESRQVGLYAIWIAATVALMASSVVALVNADWWAGGHALRMWVLAGVIAIFLCVLLGPLVAIERHEVRLDRSARTLTQTMLPESKPRRVAFDEIAVVTYENYVRSGTNTWARSVVVRLRNGRRLRFDEVDDPGTARRLAAAIAVLSNADLRCVRIPDEGPNRVTAGCLRALRREYRDR